MTKHIILLGIGILAFSFTAPGDDGAAAAGKLPAAADKKDVTFEKDIKPLFEKSCVKCHSGEKAKAKLHLDTLEGTLKGSKENKVVIPGDGAKSSLLLSVARVSSDEDQWMPPPNNKAKIAPLTTEEISLIRAWIDQGAK